jgi:hypothetical protein
VGGSSNRNGDEAGSSGMPVTQGGELIPDR